tara:strand:- start:1032 stop:1232 length:201 start_codon:yes stop_codon:yes gene_type:complete
MRKDRFNPVNNLRTTKQPTENKRLMTLFLTEREQIPPRFSIEVSTQTDYPGFKNTLLILQPSAVSE